MKSLMHALIVTTSAAAFACGGSNTGSGRNTEGSNGDMSNRNSTAANEGAGDAGGNRATLTGCLLSGGDAGSYVLQLAAADMGGGGTSSSTPSSAGNSAGLTYRIISDQNNDLQSNVNKRVAINGYVNNNTSTGPIGTSGSAGAAGGNGSGSAGSGSSSGRSQGDAGGSIPASQLPTIRAESVRKVADECRETGASNGRATTGKQ